MSLHRIDEKKEGEARHRKLKRQIEKMEGLYNFALSNIDDHEVVASVGCMLKEYQDKLCELKKECRL